MEIRLTINKLSFIILANHYKQNKQIKTRIINESHFKACAKIFSIEGVFFRCTKIMQMV